MKIQKGTYGYIKQKRKAEIIKTLVLFALSLAIYISGYKTTGSNKNLLTIVAVLGMLPASKSAVSMIMYLKAGFCSEKCFQELALKGKQITILYDLYLTSYQNNYQISALVIRNGSICGYTETKKFDYNACENHISDMLRQNGHPEYVVKLFSDPEKFAARIDQLAEQKETHPKSTEAVTDLIFSISL